MRDRLYYDQPYLTKFDAKIVAKTMKGTQCEIILSQTAFYPTSGGQPHDTGTINGVPVIDVIERDGQVVHLLTADPGDGTMHGQIDWERRLDHMQQHAGQHILSQAFIQLVGAETVGFHLGSEAVTIDLTASSLTEVQVSQVEDLANEVIWAGKPILGHWATKEEVERFPLRKAPAVDTDIRIIEVQGFDWSPCGGTHPRSASEIGLIKIRRWEKNKGQTRVEFVCGRRALGDYRWKNDLVVSTASQLSVKDSELADALERNFAALREASRQVSLLKEQLLAYEATQLHAGEKAWDDLTCVKAVFDGREFNEVKSLANKLIANPRTVALLGIRKDTPQFLFARSSDLGYDMNRLVKAITSRVGGKGGGTPASAQGAGGDPQELEQLLTDAEAMIRAGV